MILYKKITLCILLFSSLSIWGQNKLTSQEAKEKYHQFYQELLVKRDSLGQSFDTDFRTYLQQLEIIPQISDDPLFRLQFYYNKAHEYMLLGLFEEVIRLRTLYMEGFVKLPDSIFNREPTYRSRRAAFNLGQLAAAYAKLGNLDSAEATHEMALVLKKDVDTLYKASIHNNYGLFLLEDKQDYDAADYNFKIADSIMSKFDAQIHFYGSIRDNLADVALIKGDTIRARNLYWLNIDFYKKIKKFETKNVDFERLFLAVKQYITSSLAINQTEGIEQEFYDLYPYYEEIKENDELDQSKVVYHEIREIIELFNGNSAAAYDANKEIIRLNKRMDEAKDQRLNKYNELINDNTIKNIRLEYEMQKQQQAAKINSQRLKLWIISLSSLIFIGMMGFLYYRRQKKVEFIRKNQLLAEQDLELSKLKNEQLNHEIEAKKRDLSDFAINLTQSQEWAKTLAQKLADVKNSRGRERANLLKDLEDEVINKLTFDSNTKIFYERLDKLSHSFYGQLEDRYPNLTKTDRRLCSLIRLKMESHEIATLQNISISSLNTSRYRLRKKLQLAEEENLDDFILSL